MKLLFDQNLSPRLILKLADLFPAKIILVQLGNCSTDAVESALRSDQDAIKELEERMEKGLLTLF